MQTLSIVLSAIEGRAFRSFWIGFIIGCIIGLIAVLWKEWRKYRG